MNWYDELECSRCGKPLAATRRQGRPLLRAAAGATVEPHRQAPEAIAALRQTHVPICWACNLEAAFGDGPATSNGAAPKARPDENWWVGVPCDICTVPLRRGWFWQERPRAIGPAKGSFDVRSTDLASCSGPTRRYVIACTDCYHHHYHKVMEAVRALPAPQSTPRP